jgi:hypothetical protein
MNHRLKFRWEADRGLTLVDVWCPGDHGGECDMPEVTTDEHDPDECDLVLYAAEIAAGEVDSDCTCSGFAPTGRCWTKENLDLFVTCGDGWDEVLRSDIDLPWVAVDITSCGPDGNDPIEVRVIAEKEIESNG